jgi:hypothetical protein
MPILHGEGEKAFARLQEEICEEDERSFAVCVASEGPGGVEFGRRWCPEVSRHLRATSPAKFLNTSAIVAGDDARFNEEFFMTNKGMRLNSRLESGLAAVAVLDARDGFVYWVYYILSGNGAPRPLDWRGLPARLRHHGGGREGGTAALGCDWQCAQAA